MLHIIAFDKRKKTLMIDTHWDPSKIITIAINGVAGMVG